MSFWSRCQTSITDLTCFREACRKNQIEIREAQPGMQMNNLPVKWVLKDVHPERRGVRQEAYLCESGGAYNLVVDDDQGYSSISGRLGKNGGQLVRDYAEQVVMNNVTQNGGMVQDRHVQQDGSIVLRIAATG